MSRSPVDQFKVADALAEATDLVHQRSRLSIMGVLYELGEADFVAIRRITKLSDGNLSRHLQVLEDAQLVSMAKGFVGKRPRTAVRLTAKGRSAFDEEIHILRSVVAGADAVRRSKAGRVARRTGSRTAGSGADAG